MADWTDISDSAVDPDAPLTSELAYAWRDNPIAIAEGSLGAPYAQSAWHPYNGYEVGDGFTGEVWSFAADGAVSSIETPVFSDGYEYAIRAWDISHNNGSNPGSSLLLSCRRQSDDVLVVGSSVTDVILASNLISISVETIQPRRDARSHQFNSTSIGIGIVDKIKSARISWTPSGSFDAGAVYLYKRRVYA